MIQRRCFRFAYHMPVRRGRQMYPFQMRDGDAALFLSHALAERGFRFHGPLFNFPAAGPDPVPVDESFFRETDLILLSTRPPIDDCSVEGRPRMSRSFTTLEDKLFQTVTQWLARCARTEILLTDDAARVSPEIAARQSMIFHRNCDARYQSYGSPVTGEWRHFKTTPLTATFLLYAEHAWPGGPALLTAFGMGGTDTLVWCYLLATRFANLLCTTPFAMAEMRTGVWPERPESMSFADSWEVTVLGAAKLESSPWPNRAA